MVDVADNGPGVPQAVAAQLFRPFTTGGRAGGAGLGLAIARDLVRVHGGDIALAETSARARRPTLPLHSLPAGESMALDCGLRSFGSPRRVAGATSPPSIAR